MNREDRPASFDLGALADAQQWHQPVGERGGYLEPGGRHGLAEVFTTLGVADLHELGTSVLRLTDRHLAGPRSVVLPVRVLYPEQHW